MITQYTGLNYLAIDIANNFSSKLEKQNFEIRLNWFEDNKDNLDSLVQEADDKNLFICGVQAYKDYLAGKESGYLVSLDACSSGIQILAAFMGCRKSAKICGLISTDRQNAYANITQKVVPDNSIDPKKAKDAIMTTFYSSTAQPKKIFGNGELLEQYYNVLENDLPGAYLLNKSIETLWNDKTLAHEWIMPDGFTAYVPVKEKITKSFTFLDRKHEIIVEENKYSDNYRSLCANIVHSTDSFVVRELVRRCNYNSDVILNVLDTIPETYYGEPRVKDDKLNNLLMLQDKTKFYSLEILEYIDKYNVHLINMNKLLDVIETLPKKSFELISIHDAFKCLPNYGNDVRQQYNNILAEISEGTVLDFIASTLTGVPHTINKIDDIGSEIRNSEYALS